MRRTRRRTADLFSENRIGSIVSLIKSCSGERQLLELHSHLITTSLIIHHSSLSSALLSRLLSLDAFPHARLLFHHLPSPSHYLPMLKALSFGPSPADALPLYRDMLRRGLPSDPFSTSLALKSCARAAPDHHLLPSSTFEQLHARIHRDGTRRDLVLMTSLMSLYASRGTDARDAQKLFDEMPLRDTVAWNVLMSTYTRYGRTRDAVNLFEAMRQHGHEGNGQILPPLSNAGVRPSSVNAGTSVSGVKPTAQKLGSAQFMESEPPPPDDVTCLLAIRACGHLCALDLGEKVHAYVDQRGFGDVLKIRNALVAMYSRCGAVEKAVVVFRSTREKDVVGWSAVVSGLAMNGYGRDALAAFREMRDSGVAPDEQTFTGVISACAHCGFVEEGMRFLSAMRSEYGITPNVRHYGCVVDLLSRAGLLRKAYEFVTNEMDVRPDPTIWRTLLGACRVHRCFDLGERVIEHLIELKAQEAGDHVLLLNIYASVGNWEKVAGIRKMLKLKGIQTSPGCSTIELRGMVHEFVADDVSHPRKADIYAILDEIGEQLRIAGYVVNVEAEMHDLESEAKEAALSYHSEKLAIAFGVLMTPPGTTLRIAKNVRTCVDCHAFAKVFSDVYDRVVVIRDRSRFHHFRRGRCSCNDYW